MSSLIPTAAAGSRSWHEKRGPVAGRSQFWRGVKYQVRLAQRRVRRQNPIIRKVVIGTIGLTVLLAGIAMLVLPGPGMLTMFFGIAILGSEFAWAASLSRRIRNLCRNAWQTLKERRQPRGRRA